MNLEKLFLLLINEQQTSVKQTQHIFCSFYPVFIKKMYTHHTVHISRNCNVKSEGKKNEFVFITINKNGLYKYFHCNSIGH